MTARRFLHKMSIEVLTVHKECSHENNSLNYCFSSSGFGNQLADSPVVGEGHCTPIRQLVAGREIGSQAHSGSCACATIGSEPASGLSDTFSLTISHGAATSADPCAHTAPISNADCAFAWRTANA